MNVHTIITTLTTMNGMSTLSSHYRHWRSAHSWLSLVPLVLYFWARPLSLVCQLLALFIAHSDPRSPVFAYSYTHAVLLRIGLLKNQITSKLTIDRFFVCVF